MKKTLSFRLLAIVFASFMALSAYSQSDTITVVYGEDKVEGGGGLIFPDAKWWDMPEFPGGVKALREYLRDNLSYPEEAKEKGVEGRVVVQFWIEKDSTLSRIVVISDPKPLLDAEAVRMVSSMPKWKPAMKRDGELVAVCYALPIYFKLSQNNPKGEEANRARR